VQTTVLEFLATATGARIIATYPGCRTPNRWGRHNPPSCLRASHQAWISRTYVGFYGVLDVFNFCCAPFI